MAFNVLQDEETVNSTRMKAIDTAQDPRGRGRELQAAGIEAVLLYCRPDRASAETVAEFRGIGLKIGWCYEKGNPTTETWFSVEQGITDGNLCVQYASALALNPAETIFVAIDCDVDPQVIMPYMIKWHGIVKAAGYEVGVYGSGAVCAAVKAAGYCSATWLAQSTGWQAYDAWKPSADVIQGGPSIFEGDWDEVVTAGVVS